MKLAFHSATTMSSPLEKDVEVAAGAGFKALEIWTAKMDRYLEAHTLEDLKALFTRRGVQPLALSSIEFIAFRGAGYSAIQARLHELCRTAAFIGCPTIVLVPSPTPDRSLSWEQVSAEYVRVLQDLGAIARAYPVRLSFEFLGFGWCSVRTPRAAYEVILRSGCDNIGLTVDAAHFFAGGGLMDELDALDARRIFAFHLDDLEDTPKEAMTDATRLMPGLGVVPLGEICARLQRIGYDGPCSVEIFRPEYWALDPLDVAQQAHRTALEVLSPYFQVE